MKQPTGKPLVDALLGFQPTRYPIWFLRQAGRYLPEYRAIRKNTDFLSLCKNPDLASEVTLQPLKRFDLDAAIIFSDILIPAITLGQDLRFAPDHGPILNPPIKTQADVSNLKKPKTDQFMDKVAEAIVKTKSGLRADQTMIGFAGAPFTLATYMIEGQGSKSYLHVKKMLFQEPSAFEQLIETITELTIDYLKLQISAGADVVMLFDTWASALTKQDFHRFITPALTKITNMISALGTPIIYYPGQSEALLDLVPELQIDGLAIDWRIPIERAHEKMKEMNLNITTQGNLDPTVLLGSKELVQDRVHQILTKAVETAPSRHIFNVGHGLVPPTPIENIEAAIEVVRSLK